jgi:hypothetical protein
MPKPKIEQVTTWSYSRWRDYCKCPAFFKYKYMMKLPEVEGPALVRGKTIHKLSEDFLNGKIKKIPKELETFDEEYYAMRKNVETGNAEAELMLGASRNWEPAEFFGDDTIWVRGKVDIKEVPRDRVLHFIDVKSGKPNSDYENQTDLYSVLGFANYDVDTVVTSFWYVDFGVVMGGPDMPKAVYHVEDFEKLKRKWNDRTKRMMNDRRFDPTPGNHCAYCYCSKAKAGPCKY